MDWKRVDITTVEGIEKAEKLKDDGWIIYFSSFWSITFYKKVNKS